MRISALSLLLLATNLFAADKVPQVGRLSRFFEQLLLPCQANDTYCPGLSSASFSREYYLLISTQ
jgi:hypothetical protein